MSEQMALYTGLVEGDQPLALAPHVVRLLAEGRPVEPARLAVASGWPEPKVAAVLGGFPRVDWDEQGRLVGLGLTLRKTPHHFVLGERVLFAWCAMDTLLFPVMLGRTARVESVCPVTDRPVSMAVSPAGVSELDPATAVVAEVPPIPGQADLRSTVCDQTHFLADPDAAAAWQAEHPGGLVSPVAAAFVRARARITALGWAAEETR